MQTKNKQTNTVKKRKLISPEAAEIILHIERRLQRDFNECSVWRAFVQVPASRSRLQSGDVFILDMGLQVFQWNGSGASIFEKHKVDRAACRPMLE